MSANYIEVDQMDEVTVYKCLTCKSKYFDKYDNYTYCPHCGVRLTHERSK